MLVIESIIIIVIIIIVYCRLFLGHPVLLLDIAVIFYLQIGFQEEGPLAMRSGHKRILGTNL